METSVIICTHNPRSNYLHRVLEALRAQTLSTDRWELFLVDNASPQALSFESELLWHPNARCIREDELGLTAARLRGISEAKGNILVFVDDDNVLAPNYLEETLNIARDWPLLAVWGGTIKGEFEAQPEPWMEPWLAYLGLREVSKPLWSNNADDWHAQPCGAGMCVRAVVAKSYAKQVAAEPMRRRLGRVGGVLLSCEDADIIQTSCDLGYGFGSFPRLALTHLIPKSRVRADYLVRLMEGITASQVVLRYLKSGVLPSEPNRLKVWLGYFLTWAEQDRSRARIYKASQDAIQIGVKIVRAETLNMKAHGRAVHNNAPKSPTIPSAKHVPPGGY
jgi:glycosyltransferase involved in cell wall biosynthesis